MKKVEVEKLVSKSIIITVILLCLIFGTTYIQNGYFNALTFATTSKLTVGVSILFAIVAVAMVVLGIVKNSKYYVFASISAVVAIFVMLLKINYEIDGEGGFVLKQLPPAGTKINLNDYVLIVTN